MCTCGVQGFWAPTPTPSCVPPRQGYGGARSGGHHRRAAEGPDHDRGLLAMPAALWRPSTVRQRPPSRFCFSVPLGKLGRANLPISEACSNWRQSGRMWPELAEVGLNFERQRPRDVSLGANSIWGSEEGGVEQIGRTSGGGSATFAWAGLTELGLGRASVQTAPLDVAELNFGASGAKFCRSRSHVKPFLGEFCRRLWTSGTFSRPPLLDNCSLGTFGCQLWESSVAALSQLLPTSAFGPNSV